MSAALDTAVADLRHAEQRRAGANREQYVSADAYRENLAAERLYRERCTSAALVAIAEGLHALAVLAANTVIPDSKPTAPRGKKKRRR